MPPWTQTQVDDFYYLGVVPAGADCHLTFHDNVIDQTGNDAALTGGSHSTDVLMVRRQAA